MTPNGHPAEGPWLPANVDNNTVFGVGFALRDFFRNAGHLIRPALVLLAGLGVFLIIRAIVVPKDFGKYGHYRPGALDMVRPAQFPTRARASASCATKKKTRPMAAGKHAGVRCEACHGPLAKHADDPEANVPKLPDVANLCRRCHEKDAAKPKGFPQVDTVAHSQGMLCNTCHQPHNPHL